MSVDRTRYIFVLCPPYAGSTILWRLLSTSAAVSALPREGLRLAGVGPLLAGDVWDPEVVLRWAEIREVWMRSWDPSKPLLIEKSPSHLVRLQQIHEHFGPVYSVIMVRDPYAHTEGVMRRFTWDARRAAEFCVSCLRHQAENRRFEPCLSLTYEDLADRTEETCGRLRDFLPGLGDLDHHRKFSVHSIDGYVTRPIVNLNEKKVRQLTPRDRRTINDVLRANDDVMEAWGYRVLDAAQPASGEA